MKTFKYREEKGKTLGYVLKLFPKKVNPVFILPDEPHRHKFDENIQIELKNSGDLQELLSFRKLVGELKGEGEHYSLNRESFIKFFNDLSAHQQKELLALVSSEASGKNVYDIAQEYNAKLLQSK